jgi:ribosomal protein S18 acetylase RimI-like enzyme
VDLTLRAVQLPHDVAAIRAIDTSLTTRGGFAVSRASASSILSLRVVDPPITKRFELDDLDADDRPWDEGAVALSGDRVIGFVATSFQPWHRRLVLWHLYVDPPFRRRGVGGHLLSVAHDRATRDDAEHLWLETSNLNVPGAEFYTSLGFEICGFDLTHYAGTSAAEEFAIFMAAQWPPRTLHPRRSPLLRTND